MQEEINELKQQLLRMDQLLKAQSSLNPVVVPPPKPLDVHNGDLMENFKFFKFQWEQYGTSTGLNKQPEEVKVATLLSFLGEDCIKIYQNFPIKDENKTDAKKLLDEIGKNLAPPVNKRHQRALFNMAKQEENERYDDYFNRLRGLIQNCQYDNMADDLLLDKIICSIKNVSLREQLWLNEDITLAKAIEKCKSKEQAEKQLAEIDSNTKKNSNEEDVYKFQHRGQDENNHYPKNSSKNSKQFQKIQCQYCGYWHERDINKCAAKGKKCKNCGKMDHFASMCRSAKNLQSTSYNVKTVNQEDNDDFVLSVEDKRGKFFTADLMFCVRDQIIPVQCMLDTGATCNVVGINNICKILGENPKLTKTNIKLKNFGNTYIETIGELSMPCVYKNNKNNLSFQVVEIDHIPLLSGDTCEKLGLIKICTKIDQHTNEESKRIIDKYKCNFEGIGTLEGEVSLKLDKDAHPVMQKPRRIAVTLNDELKKELLWMEKNGIIVKDNDHSDWVSNILVTRRNGKIRICIDPNELNNALLDRKYVMPTLDEILPELENAKVFSTLDARKGFWQLKLDEKSSKLTTFYTPYGKYRFLRMPFGLKPAMEIYQAKQHEVINGLKGVVVIADDILVYGKGSTIEEATKDHNINLEQLMIRIKERNSKLNPDKINLCATSVRFYGHILTNNGLKADPLKIKAINAIPPPKNKKELVRFLGMISYLGRYIKELSKIAEPLRNITHDDSEFTWSDSQQAIFANLKKIITESTTLKYFEVNKPLTIQTDASSFAMGATIMQDGIPISYASKKLTESQQSYSQLEKELLAILFACTRFDQYVCGKSDVMVETDHEPLIKIAQRRKLLDTPKRIQSMLMYLKRYNIKLKYLQGTKMYIADLLSRAPVDSTDSYEKNFDVYSIEQSDMILNKIDQVSAFDDLRISNVTLKKIRDVTQRDEIMQTLLKMIVDGWPTKYSDVKDEIKQYYKFKDELSIENGIIIKRNRLLIPPEMRKEILNRLHASHQGIEYTMKLARDTVFWPNINEQLREKISSCEACQKFAPNQSNPSMMSHPIPNRPFQLVSLDVFEIEIKDKKRHFLVTVDHFSDFFEIDELNDLSTKGTITICKRNFSRHGIPEKVVADNGTNLSSKEFRAFAKEWEFTIETSSPHHQQGNGKSEAAVKQAKSLIKKSVYQGEDFYMNLLQWRNTPNKTDYSPAQKMFTRRTRSIIPTTEEKLMPVVLKDIEEKIEHQRYKAKYYYDRKATQLHNLNPGQKVMAKINPKSKEWHEATVQNLYKPRSYIIATDNNTYRRNRVHLKPLVQTTLANEPNVEHDVDINQSIQNSTEPSTATTSTTPIHSEQQQQRPKRNTKPPVRFQDYDMSA